MRTPRCCFLFAAWAACCVTACGSGSSPTVQDDVQPPVASADAIADRPVEGRLRGQSFVAGDARYVVDRRSGNEHVDIALSAARAPLACGPLDVATPMRVWLRRRGVEPVAAGEQRLSPSTDAPWELHYQLLEQGQWVGSSRAAALVRFEASEPGAPLRGSLAACFADGRGSCVTGRFVATHCPEPLGAPVRGNEPTEALPPDAGAPAVDAAPRGSGP